jgi:hypothetical protein
MLSMILISAICLLNLAIGFALAVLFGHGPSWAERLVPRAWRP